MTKPVSKKSITTLVEREYHVRDHVASTVEEPAEDTTPQRSNIITDELIFVFKRARGINYKYWRKAITIVIRALSYHFDAEVEYCKYRSTIVSEGTNIITIRLPAQSIPAWYDPVRKTHFFLVNRTHKLWVDSVDDCNDFIDEKKRYCNTPHRPWNINADDNIEQVVFSKMPAIKFENVKSIL